MVFQVTLGKFNSWNAFSSKFHAQFSSSRQLPSHLEELVEVKQMLGEPLRAYISMLMTEATKVKGLTKEGRFAAILRGVEPLRELWKDIKRLTVGSMAKFLDRTDGFIKHEEVVQRIDTVRQNKNQQHTTLAGMFV
uniref:Retrotransposon gag domain-containing protein n=1 Tax=Cannabis sativa TaxID=3483 RepID=A0A803P5E9_CANSA